LLIEEDGAVPPAQFAPLLQSVPPPPIHVKVAADVGAAHPAAAITASTIARW